MSDIIKLLPDSVANQIAAGEVIQRPASVIKELVENSVDAGATRIDVVVIDAGRTLIQVIDNGKGMSETDARMSFERHATSKISQAADLFELRTMGFRGEALASIAAVAQVELKTRTANDQIGTSINISGSKVISQESASCPVGSNFQIKNLFFNVPARRRFLKSNTTELNNIISAFEHIVLVYPQIAFTLHSNGTEIYNLPSTGLRQRIIDVAGKKINPSLLPINVDTSLARVTGFVGKPESARKKNASQYFFVNGRYMRHPYFHKAVLSAYERLIANGDQPPYFIYIEVEPSDIDVNIHPVKTEIKFENEQPIWQLLLAGVREALVTFCEIPKLDFTDDVQPELPSYYNPHPSPLNRRQTESNQALLELPRCERSEGRSRDAKRESKGCEAQRGKDTKWLNPQPSTFNPQPSTLQLSLYDNLLRKPVAADEVSLFVNSEHESSDSSAIADKSPVHYQYKASYIMTAVKSGLMIIDQHRAHIRILFEQMMRTRSTGHENIQKVLFPEVVELSPSEVMVLDKISDELAMMGFEILNLGGGSYSVNGIPAGLKDVNPLLLFQDVMRSACDGTIDIRKNLLYDLCLTLAQSAAIPHGQILSNAEMEDVINRLFACENPNYTPNGKSILTVLDQNDLEKMLN